MGIPGCWGSFPWPHWLRSGCSRNSYLRWDGNPRVDSCNHNRVAWFSSSNKCNNKQLTPRNSLSTFTDPKSRAITTSNRIKISSFSTGTITIMPAIISTKFPRLPFLLTDASPFRIIIAARKIAADQSAKWYKILKCPKRNSVCSCLKSAQIWEVTPECKASIPSRQEPTL